MTSNKAISSAIAAAVLTSLWAFAMFGPFKVLNLLGLIAVMLPLWMLHDLGVSGLGTPVNGFFVPTNAGYALGTVVIWLVCFIAFALLLRGKRPGSI